MRAPVSVTWNVRLSTSPDLDTMPEGYPLCATAEDKVPDIKFMFEEHI
jgi:hypothetical protein